MLKNAFEYLHIPFLLCLIFLTTGESLYGKNPLWDHNTKNTIYLDVATIKITGMFSLNYERTILISRKIRMHACAGIGGWYFTTLSQCYNGTSLPLSINSLVGKDNHRFEIDFGLRYTFFSKNSEKDITPFFPVFNMGYRYQRQDGRGLVFRAFLGTSGAGIGIGKAF